MKLVLYLILLISLSTAIVELHASEINHGPSSDEELQVFELKLERKQIAHMLTILEKSGRLDKEEVVSAKRSLASLDKDELQNFKFQVRDLIDKN